MTGILIRTFVITPKPNRKVTTYSLTIVREFRS